MDTPEVELMVAVNRSTVDARRGIARAHPWVLRSLGLRAWDALELRGRRTTGALVAPSRFHESILLLDDISCANARVEEGDTVAVRRAEAAPASRVEMANFPEGVHLEPELLRLAFLGKVMCPGDRVGLLPQDFTGDDGGDHLDRLVTSLRASLGEEWGSLSAMVSAVDPDGLVRVTMETQVSVAGGPATSGSSTPIGRGSRVTIEDLPGLEPQFERLRELLELAFNRPEVLLKLGVTPRLGVLVSGPPGSGKGALVDAVASTVGVEVHRRWGPALARRDPAGAAGELESVIREAQSGAPAIVVIEDIDSIAPRSEAGPLTSVLFELFSTALASGSVAILCTTSHPESIAPELTAPGMLEHAIDVPLPHKADRRRILEVHTRRTPLAPDVKLDEIADRSPGFVAADLMALARQAAINAAQRTARAGAPFVTGADFEAALEVVKPSTLDGMSVEVADVSMEDVGDMDELKRELTEAVVWPLSYPETFHRMGVEPAKGVLLYGPPGCGKTFLVKALANHVHANFLSVKGAELLSKWVGESERSVRELFRRARGASPAIIFFDEIDALAPIRGRAADTSVTERVVAAMLTELDGIEDLSGVVVIGATNRPDLVDPALLRPGRLERLLFVPPPDAGARGAILAAAVRRMPIEPGVDIARIATECEGFSAADLEGLARRAAMAAMRAQMDTPRITADHFATARAESSPSLNPGALEELEAFAARAGGRLSGLDHGTQLERSR